MDTKKRLQKRIGVSDKDIAKYKFSLIQSALFKQPAAIEESAFSSLNALMKPLTPWLFPDDIIFDHKFLPEDVLGLDHIDRTGKAGRSGPGEKAIVIKG